MSLSRSDKLGQRHFIFFDDTEEIGPFFDGYGSEVSIQDIKEVQGQIIVIFTDMEVE